PSIASARPWASSVSALAPMRASSSKCTPPYWRWRALTWTSDHGICISGNAEDVLGVGSIHADAVVAHGEEPLCPFSGDRNRYPWGLATVLDGIADQVLKHLAQLRRIGRHGRQICV